MTAVPSPPDTVGLTAITARLRVGSRATIWAYTRLERDPLTLRRFVRRVWQRTAHLDEWRERHLHGPAAQLPRLQGLRTIGEFVGRGTTIAQLLGWARRTRDPLPLFGDEVVFESALRDWCFRHDQICLPDDAPAGRSGRRLVERAGMPGNQAPSALSI
jgi:hypothetical protein